MIVNVSGTTGAGAGGYGGGGLPRADSLRELF